MGKKLGQHFLINPEVARNIVNILSLRAQESVLEIGPGKGFLTSYLVETDAQITGIEIDSALSNYLKKKFKKLKVINEDFLNINLNEFDFDKICGNIPYQIAGKIIEKIMLSTLNWKICILMLPDVVAKRVVAGLGTADYSFLSVMCNANCKTGVEFVVNKENFDPEPKIDSSVVSFHRTGSPFSKNFYKLTRAAFSKRRKNIKNSLSMYFSKSADEIEKILDSLGISPVLRAQDLSIEEFKKVAIEFVSNGIL